MKEITTKVCSKCKQEKSITEFGKNKNHLYGIRNDCKSCRSVESRQYRDTYPNRFTEYRKTHLDKFNEYDIKFRNNNPNYYREYFNQYNKRRRSSDANFRLITNLRRRLVHFLKDSKSLHTHDYICCTYEQLWDHLEKQFNDGMTRENYGKIWHVDHIIPLQFFIDNDLLDETTIKIACHYGNLQPLLVEENLAKSSKIPQKTNFNYYT